MVRLPADVSPTKRLPVEPLAAAPTPSTAGLAESMVTAAGLVGTTPPDQFVPSVQSALVAPVQLCAAADAADNAVSATEALRRVAHPCRWRGARRVLPVVPA